MHEKRFYVYILTNKPYGVFYIGITSSLAKRVYEHRQGVVEGFSKRYHLKMLVYYEIFEDAPNAIAREKRLKRWPRQWKIEAIMKMNPEWNDLYEQICI